MEEKLKKIINFSIILLCLIIPVAFYPKLENVFELFKITILRIVVLVIFSLYLFISVYMREIKIPKNPVLFPIVLYLLTVVFSTAISYQKFTSYNEAINIFTYFIFLFLVISFYEKEKNILISTAISFSSAVVSLYALLQHLKIDFIEWDSPLVYTRSTSTLGNPDFVSAYLSIVLPVVLSFLIIQKNKFFKSLLFLNFVLNFTALLFTYSRGGWITFVFVMAIFFYLLEKEKLRENISYILGLFLCIVAISTAGVSRKVLIDNKVTDISGRIKSIVDLNYPSFSIRRHLWHDALLMIREKPLLGWGPDTFTSVFFKFRSPELSYLAGRTNLPENPHNDYLNICCNSGFFGLFAFLFFCVSVLKYSLRKLKEDILYLGMFSAIVGFLFQSLFYYKVVPTATLFFLFSGILVKEEREKISLKINFHLPTIFLIYSFIFICTFYFIIISLFEIVANKHYRKGKSYIDAHQYLQAETEFMKATVFSPYNKNYKLALGRVYEEIAIHLPKKKKEIKKFLFKKGIEKYKEAINLDRNDPHPYADLGRIYFHYSEIDKKYRNYSIKNYKIAQKLDPKNCVFYNDLGVIYLAFKEYEKAKSEFEKATKLEPHYAEAWENLGMCYYYLDEKEKAISYLKKAIDEQDLFSAYIRIVFILKEVNKKDKAILYLKKADKLFPKNPVLKKLLKDFQKDGKRK